MRSMKMKSLFAVGCLLVGGASASLRIVSYNIYHGEGADKVINIDRTASVIAQYNPDLVAIQEIDNNTTRSGRVNQAAELGRKLGMEYRFKKSINYRDGGYGIAILSAYPIKHTILHNLPTPEGEEPRGALEVVVGFVDEDGQTNALSFVCAHLGLNNEQRVAQVQALVRELSARGHAVVVSGDLNAEPREDSIKNLEGAGFVPADEQMLNTFPAKEPVKKIDYILTKDLPIRHRRFVVDGNPKTSDHRLVFCEFLLGKGCAADTVLSAHLDAIVKSFKNAKDGKVLVAAHRGDFKHHPENSISSIVSAANFGADIVEVDVWPTKDGHLVLMHDKTIDRTTNGKGKVAELTLAELKQYNLKDPQGNLTEEKIPTLEEALEALRGKCIVNLDKSEHNLEMCIAVTKKMGMENQVLMKGSKDPEKMKAIWDAADAHAFYGPIVFNKKKEGNAKALEKLKRSIDVFKPEMVELVFLREDSSLISPEALALADKYDVRLWSNSILNHGAGHVDSKALKDPDAHWGWLVEHGIDIIQSDESLALLEYLRSKGLHD